MYRSSIVIFVVIALLALCIGQSLAVDRDRSYVSGNNFLILDNVKCGFTKSVDGGGISAEIIQEPSGPDYFVKKHIGQPNYEDFIIQIGFGMAKPINDWIASSWNMNYQRHSGGIVACDFNLKAKSERQFSEALITETTIPACDGSSKEPAYMTIKVSPEITHSVAPENIGNAGEYSKNDQKIWLPSNFRLTIDGLDCSRVSKIDSFTIKQAIVTDDIGDARDYAKEPGKLEFPNLKITLSESDAESWVKWHEDFVIKGHNSEDFEKSGTLVFLGPGRQTELAKIKFYNLGIFKIEPTKAEDSTDQIKRFTAELYCERMEFDTSQSGTQSTAAPVEDKAQPSDGKGEWGKTYSICRFQPLNFTLKSANYSVEPLTIAKKYFSANADEKLLVLHFDVQNPGKTERLARYDQLLISAVDETQMNHPQRQAWGFEKTNELAAFNLAPNQKVSLFCVVAVPAKGEPSTILVKSSRANDGPDLPYDVHGHVPALSAPFVDPSDQTGATILEEVPAKLGNSYPYDFFAVTVEDMAFTRPLMSDVKISRGTRSLVCTLLVKNQAPEEHLLRHDMIQSILTTKEGERMKYQGMLLESSDRAVAQLIRPGEEMRVRISFLVPKGVTPKQLLIQEHKSRRYLYKVSI